jgi:hypothetical protein
VEFVLVIYPVTHLPGSNTLKINMIIDIITGARNPSVFSIEKSYDLKIVKKSKVESQKSKVKMKKKKRIGESE